MSLPALQVRCPRCQGLNLVPPHLAGSTQACVVCRTAFVVPPTGYASPVQSGPLPPHLRSLATAPPVALPPQSASATTTPTAQPLEVPRRPSRWIGLLMRVSLVAIAASVVVAVVLIPRALKTLQQAQFKKKEVETPPPDVVDIFDLRPVGGGPIKWIDASRSSGMRTGMIVRVTRCEYGPVMARDNVNQPLIAGPGEFLQIHLKITNRLKSKARYISWYANSFRDGNEQVAAKLSDADGREYPPQRFSGVKMIESHVDDVTLEPGESTNDVLIFALPAAKGSGEGNLRLQLPAAAVARTGWFNFKLPPELWER